MRIANALSLVPNVAIAAGRLVGHKEQWFQAVAHLYLGILLGAMLATWIGWRNLKPRIDFWAPTTTAVVTREFWDTQTALVFSVGFLTTVEVLCFLGSR